MKLTIKNLSLEENNNFYTSIDDIKDNNLYVGVKEKEN